MVLDTRIAMGVQPLDVGASLGRGYQLRDLAAQSEARKLDNQAKQRAIQKQATLGDLYKGSLGADGSVDRTKLTQGMIGAGYGADLPELQKGWGEMDKAQAESRSKMLENGIKANNYITSQIAGLMMKQDRSPADAYAAIDHLAQMGFLPPEQVQQYRLQVPTNNPQAMDNWLRTMLVQSLEGKEQLAAMLPKVSAENLGGHTQMVDTNPLTNPSVVGQRLERSATPGDLITDRHYRASEGLQVRGQNMADARAREANATALSRPFEVTGPDGKPMLVQQDKAGGIHPVSNYSPKSGQEKNLTDSQAKAVAFGARTQASNRIFDELEARGTTTSILGSQAGYLGDVITGLSSEEQQRLDQAKRDFINAVLRRESGAVISQPEFDNAERQYFPQYGEGKGTIMQKRRNREIAMRGIQAEVPENKRYLIGEVIGSDSAGDSNGSSSGKVVNFSDLK